MSTRSTGKMQRAAKEKWKRWAGRTNHLPATMPSPSTTEAARKQFSHRPYPGIIGEDDPDEEVPT